MMTASWRRRPSRARRHRRCRSGTCSRHRAIYGIIIGTFAYNYFNYFCMTWLPAYFIENWKLTKTDMGLFTAFSFSGMAVVAILAGVVADRLIAKGWDVIKVRRDSRLPDWP